MVKLATISFIAIAIFAVVKRSGKRVVKNAAFDASQPHDSHQDNRDAGPQAMRDKPEREWTEIDEDLDESFPASDPPGGY